MAQENKRLLTIGVLINQLDGVYQSTIWHSVQKLSYKLGFRFTLFAGKPLLSPYEYETQYNSIYPLARAKRIDGIIVLSGVQTNFATQKQCEVLLSQYGDKPMVCIAIKVADYPVVLVDSKSGVRESIIHLVREHKLKKIAFIKGSENHTEGKERFAAYRETLDELGIPYDPCLVFHGNFVIDSGKAAVKEMLDVRKVIPEAIVTANDAMLLGVYEELAERNIQVPREIALIGFDDIIEVQFQHPPATTGKQPFFKQVESSIFMLMDQINGRGKQKDITLPSELVIRQSCGCHSRSSSGRSGCNEINRIEFPEGWSENISIKACLEIDKEIDQIPQEKQWILDFVRRFFVDMEKVLNGGDLEQFLKSFNDNLLSMVRKKINISFWKDIVRFMDRDAPALFTEMGQFQLVDELFQKANMLCMEINSRVQANMITEMEIKERLLLEVCQLIVLAFQEDELIEILIKQLPRLDIPRFALVLYDDAVRYDQSLNWELPEYSRLLVAFDDGLESKKITTNKTFRTEDLFPEGIFKIDGPSGLVAFSLFFRTKHFGYLLLEVTRQPDALYETLRGQISVALKGIEHITMQEKAGRDLNNALKALEESYRKLEDLSVLDELTGLYNRRGFMAIARQNVDLSRRLFRDFLLLYIDLEVLKP